jgi:DNA processing protein
VQTHSIVSGFMYGVDVTAQQVALQQAGGRTIGVLGFGFEHCFPRSQRQLMEEFVARGAIFLTEFAPRISAHAGNFVQRNRIIAGLAPATLVIEAAERSGSHITAAYANEYGRLVMAVPGPITNPYSQGTKALIEQGATLVTSSRDIYQALGEDYQSALTLGLQSDTGLSATIVEALTSQSALNFDELLAISQQDKSLLQQSLLRLELAGKIHKSCGTYCLS